jgi:hypothetical protein
MTPPLRYLVDANVLSEATGRDPELARDLARAENREDWMAA